MFPPVPFGLARVVGAQGLTIGGRYFAPGVGNPPTLEDFQSPDGGHRLNSV